MAVVVRLYTGQDGKSHLEELPNAYAGAGTPEAEAFQAAKGVIFRHTSGDTVSDWHTAPRRQYFVTISGEFEIEVGDGSKHRFRPGDVLLAEDTWGEGHITRSFGERRSVIIPLA